MDQFRRSLLLAPFALALVAGGASAAPIPLSELSRYLNSIQTAEAQFTQTNADGSRSNGMLYIHRPNRMRFEYAPPNEALVLASAGQVAIFDSKSNQPPEQYPLSRTPLNLILARNVDLSRAGMVVGHEQSGADTAVVARDPQHPEYGTIRLIFAPGPVLKQWVITDDTGSRTTVNLGPLLVGRNYPPSHFSINAEMNRR